jgi:transcription elongation factor Elf1
MFKCPYCSIETDSLVKKHGVLTASNFYADQHSDEEGTWVMIDEFWFVCPGCNKELVHADEEYVLKLLRENDYNEVLS